MPKLMDLPVELHNRRWYGVYSDFNHYVSADEFTSVATDSGTISVLDGVTGRLTINASDGTVADNDESYVRSTTEIFLVADNRPLVAEAYLQYTEANTDDANVFFGFANNIAANFLVDDGAGLRTTGNYFALFKLDGETTWRVRSRNGTETETHDTGITAGGASYQRLRIEIDNEGDGGTNVQVKFFIDDLQCTDVSSAPRRPIVHTIAIASSTEMQVGCGVKNGGANGEVLVVDYMGGWQYRGGN